MKKYRTALAATLFGVLALGFAGPSMAHGDRYGPPGNAWGHHKHHHHHERGMVYYGPPAVIVRQPAPLFVPAPAYVPAPVYYEPAYYYPVPRRSPSLSVGIDIPLR